MHVLFLVTLLLQPAPLYIVSPDFEDGGTIPTHCTCDGRNTNPTLIVHGIPKGTRSLALIVEDTDSPLDAQWLAWNIPPVETLDGETFLDITGNVRTAGNYRGPCPESGAVQRYAFNIYALDTLLTLPSNTGRIALEKTMDAHILAAGKLQGTYSRSVVVGNRKRK